MKIKLTIAYDGTNYHGWQIQPGKRTIQGEIEKALEKLYKKKVKLIVSGRTDAGVHARGQVAAGKVFKDIPPLNVKLALNTFLPEDIAIIDVERVSDDFNPRFSAKKKLYRYQILNQRIRDPFLKRYAWLYPYPLSISLIEKAASFFVGEHDFSAFRGVDCSSKSTVRKIYSISIKKEKNLILIDFEGSGFLKQMVRIMTGTLVDIGRGRFKPEIIKGLLKEGDRKKAGVTAPSEGLFLMKVYF